MDIEKDYKKFRWFFTSKDNLVIAGKNAEQNDSLLFQLKKQNKDYTILHTSNPGSPFSVILSDSFTKKELHEAAVFTACFSQTWKSSKKTANISIFNLSDMSKNKIFKKGTWSVKKSKNIEVEMSLVLTLQKGVLRAVPKTSVKKDSILLIINQGKSKKEDLIREILSILGTSFSREDILSALPAGGIAIST